MSGHSGQDPNSSIAPTLDQLSVVEFSLNALAKRSIEPATVSDASNLEQQLDSVTALVEQIRSQSKAKTNRPKFEPDSLFGTQIDEDSPSSSRPPTSPTKLTTVGAVVHPTPTKANPNSNPNGGRALSPVLDDDSAEEMKIDNNDNVQTKMVFPKEGRR